MNAETLLNNIKQIVANETGYPEHNPRSSRENPIEPLPNTGVFRVVFLGTGKVEGRRKDSPLRYADFAIVLSIPLSGGDSNKSNLDAANDAEKLITALAEYDNADSTIPDDIGCEITREAGRVTTSFILRSTYDLI